MIREQATVVSIETDCLWVETIQQSTCQSCSAEKGCGQKMLAQWSGHTTYLRVPLEARSPAQFTLGDQVEIGIANHTVVLSSLLAYLLPLVLLVLGGWLGNYAGGGEAWSVVGALLGLLFGGLLVYLHGQFYRDDPQFQPVLLNSAKPVEIQP